MQYFYRWFGPDIRVPASAQWSGLYALIISTALLCATYARADGTAHQGMPKPAPWQPDKVVVFGDSMSDSHGDSFRKPDYAYSTYNLLRTLNGEMNTLPDGSKRRPMDLDKIISKRMTIENIKANFDLTVSEIRKEAKERSYIGKIMSYLEADAIHTFASMLDSVLRGLDSTEDSVARSALPLLSKASKWVASKVNGMTPGSWLHSLMSSIGRQLEYVSTLLEQGVAGTLLDFGDDQVINIISRMPGSVPLIPDPIYYATGKWTTSSTDLEPLVWIEFLQKMMSGGGHPVKLDNRSMAGSWTLCAYDKVKSFKVIDELTDGVLGGVKMLFQGSMIPPCEGLIVQSYLNEARNKFEKAHGRTPDPDDKLFAPPNPGNLL